jgi:hypothetical protein
LALQFEGKFYPAHLKGCLVKIEQTLNEESVVIGKPFDFAPTLTITAEQKFSRLIVKLCPNKLRCSRCCFQIGRIIQDLGASRECGDHQAIPSRNDFVVQMRTRTFAADRK